jgi:tetratricopeptide (TPR) repeat protein
VRARNEIQFVERICSLVLRIAFVTHILLIHFAVAGQAARAAWTAHREAGLAAFEETRYLDALEHFRNAHEKAQETGAPPEVRGKLLTSIGACLLGLSDYRGALSHFVQARRHTEQGGNREDLAALDANIASAYLLQDDRESAARIYRRALGWLASVPESRHRPSILANLAAVELRAGRYRQGLRYVTQGLEALGSKAPAGQQAAVHDLAGLAYLGLRDRERAREAFERGLVLRRSSSDQADLSRSWMFLGRTQLEQGAAAAAVSSFDRAIEHARARDSRVNLWEALYWRSRCHRGLRRPAQAAQDLREAVNVLESMHVGLIPTDAVRVQFEGYHNAAYAELAELLCESGEAAEAFQVVERSRSLSLRALVRGRSAPVTTRERDLWMRYTEGLARLESARARGAPVAGQEAALRELESRLRVEDPVLSQGLFAPALSLAAAQKALDRDSLLLNFHAGERATYLWAVTDGEMKCYRLAPRSAWQATARELPTAPDAGPRLYRVLLGSVDPSLLDRPHWIIAAEGELALLPFAALRMPSGRYVAEERALSFVPSISVLNSLRGRPGTAYRADFLAVADPVLNRADPRGAGALKCGAEKVCAPLPRLVSSEAEAGACARQFPAGRATVLTGLEASEARLRSAAAGAFRYWHFSSHVVVDTERPNHSFIALTLPDRLTVYDVLSLPVQADMVTLSGCDSGVGKSLPGAGILGLSRAFLAAGARSVCATLWKVPDEGGALVQRVYAHLQAGTGRAEALRRAQVEMIRAGDWRSEPRYWAAYYLLGDAGRPGP